MPSYRITSPESLGPSYRLGQVLRDLSTDRASRWLKNGWIEPSDVGIPAASAGASEGIPIPLAPSSELGELDESDEEPEGSTEAEAPGPEKKPRKPRSRKKRS